MEAVQFTCYLHLDLFVLRGNQWVKVSREALGAACSKCDTATRLLAPTHFVKVDQGILPVVDYLHIDLADVLGSRSVNTALST